jgi:hypothetical protein
VMDVESDQPTERDQLGRLQYVGVLADVIRHADTPLVIAIYGAWGTGKTSMMLQLRRNLDPDFDVRSAGVRDSTLSTVWFDPWMHQFDDAPALGLLHAAGQQLGISRERNVTTALAKLAVAMGEDVQIPFIGVRVSKILRIREEMAQDDFNRREEQARLRSHFRTALEPAIALNRRVVFFIDDLDRCQPSTAVKLLEALKLYLDFKGCVYVLAVDREPLEAAVATEYRELGLRTESYLDKIIQLPFTIPSIRQDHMGSYVGSHLPEDLQSCRDVLAVAASDEPRSVKRVANALLINHRLAASAEFGAGYDPRILAVVILIQNHAPDLYRELRLDPSIIHDVYRYKEGPEASSTLEESASASEADLWTKYIAMKPRLDRALRLVDIPSDVDLTPYVTLTGTVRAEEPSKVSGLLEESEVRVFLSYARSSTSMARRLVAELSQLGWAIATADLAAPIGGTVSGAVQSLISSAAAMLVLVGGEEASSGGWRDSEFGIALELGIPVIPVLYGDPPRPEWLPRDLMQIQSVMVDESAFERSLAVLDRALRSVTQVTSEKRT